MIATRMTTRALAALMGMYALLGCASQVDEEPTPGEAAVSEQPLLINDDGIWSDPSISVCWKSYADSTSSTRIWARLAIEREYEAISDLDFTGWGECTAAGAEIVIDVNEDNWPKATFDERSASANINVWLNFFGTTSRDLDDDGDLDFQNCYSTQSPVTGETGRTWPHDRRRCIEIVIAHEFAHVLGIRHEQNRTDAPENCGGGGTSTLNHFGYFDLSSISAYCNPVWNNDGRLSVLDVAGVQEFYGTQASDHLWLSLGNQKDYAGSGAIDLMTFEVREQSVSGTQYIPVAGDFNADDVTDIFWYGPGAVSDSIWFFDLNGGHTSLSKAVDGTSYQPLVGDFNDDDYDDIFLFNPAAGADYIWFFGADGTHTVRSEVITGNYRPVVGDFDGDGQSDVFWHMPGTGGDWIWFFNEDKTHSTQSETVNGTYEPLAGDFNGDLVDDVFMYAPGSATDAIWSYATNGSHTSVSVEVNGTYQPQVGDYDGDLNDDIFWFRAGTGSDSFWLMGNTEGSYVTSQTRYDGGGVAIAGDFNGDGLWDLFFYD